MNACPPKFHLLKPNPQSDDGTKSRKVTRTRGWKPHDESSVAIKGIWELPRAFRHGRMQLEVAVHEL